MKKRIYFALIVGWFIYFSIKYIGPIMVEHLFAEQSFALLNFFSQNHGKESLEFYQGRIQEVFLGPLTQTISFALLAFMICRFFREASFKVFAALIFIFLLITKFEVLLFPPYGDAIGGPFAEALWLYHNGFNYFGLFNEPNFTLGGQRVYFFSIYPGWLALTLKLIPWTKVFLAFHHVVTFALTAAIISLLRECSRKYFEPTLTILISLVMLALPLFQSQSEAINMEMPVAFFMIWSAYALINKHWGKAAFFACFAALIKGIGVISCGVVAVMSLIYILRNGNSKERLKLALVFLVTTLVGIFIVSAKFLFHDAHVQQGMVRWDAGWPSLKKEFIFYLFLSAVAIFIFNSIQQFLRKKNEDVFIPSVMFLFAGGWFLLFLNFYAVSPRYRVALYPFLVFVVIYAVTLISKSKILNRCFAVTVMLAACIMSYGSFYGSVPENDHVILERSLEYRNDLELNRRIVKIAQQRYSDKLIVAPFTIAQILAIPELGYVDKKLKVMIYGFSLQYGNIANYPGLKNMNILKTVFVGVKVAEIAPGFYYPQGPKDLVLNELAVGNKKASFFMGGYAIESLWRVTHNKQLKK